LKIYWTQEFSEISGDEDRIIGMLSENLKNKLIREANEAILTQCPLFKAHFSVESKAKILKVMKTIVVNPEHAITSTLPLFGEPCLCYIETGYLDVFIRQSGGNEGDGLTTYLQGHYFGMEEFITGHSNTIKMISQQFVKLIVLQRSEFLKIIAENPLDYEEFCMIKDQYQLKSKVVEIVDNVAR
jgi:CRP-like cAMP-binding protein